MKRGGFLQVALLQQVFSFNLFTISVNVHADSNSGNQWPFSNKTVRLPPAPPRAAHACDSETLSDSGGRASGLLHSSLLD